MRRITIVLDEDLNKSNCIECAKVTIQEKNGKLRSRVVTMESLIGALAKSVVKKAVKVPVGKIPFGYYDATLGEEQGKLCAEVITVLPSGRQILQYESTRYDICLPSLVFKFVIDKGRVYSTYVYVMKDEVPTDDSRLYRYPFGNVNGDGHVCWGTNVLPDICELKSLEEVMTLFVQSPCNNDYYNGKDYCNHKDITLRQLFEILKDEEDYPGKYLVPLKQGMRNMFLKDIITWRKDKLKGRRKSVA